jgi:hypothetical protein
MNKQCKHIEADGFHHCGSYAFNLKKDGIEQGDLCDRHYWQDQAMKAAAQEREECAKVCEEDGLLWGQRYAAAIRARGTT